MNGALVVWYSDIPSSTTNREQLPPLSPQPLNTNKPVGYVTYINLLTTRMRRIDPNRQI